VISFEQIGSHNASFVTSNWGQRRPATCSSIAGCIHSGVGNALQLIVHFDATLLGFDRSGWQIQVFDIGHPSGTMDNEVCLKRFLRTRNPCTNLQAMVALLNCFHVSRKLNVRPQLPSLLKKFVHQIRVEALQQALPAMENYMLLSARSETWANSIEMYPPPMNTILCGNEFKSKN